MAELFIVSRLCDVVDVKPQKGKEKDIYVAGSNDGKIVYWKNGVENVLAASGSKDRDASCISVAGADVVAGRRDNNAVYWKNGNELALSTDSIGIEEARSILIDDEIFILRVRRLIEI